MAGLVTNAAATTASKPLYTPAEYSIGYMARYVGQKHKKLDGVGPVDNRPFTDKLQQIVKKNQKKKKK